MLALTQKFRSGILALISMLHGERAGASEVMNDAPALTISKVKPGANG
jgi:hypothetical protein